MKRVKNRVFGLKNLLFSGIFLSGIGGYSPPPLNGKSLCPKKLSGKGGYPPLNGQNPLSSFWRVPLLVCEERIWCPGLPACGLLGAAATELSLIVPNIFQPGCTIPLFSSELAFLSVRTHSVFKTNHIHFALPRWLLMLTLCHLLGEIDQHCIHKPAKRTNKQTETKTTKQAKKQRSKQTNK